jgi:hypothetical protein
MGFHFMDVLFIIELVIYVPFFGLQMSLQWATVCIICVAFPILWDRFLEVELEDQMNICDPG